MKKAISYMACSMAAMLALSACGSAASSASTVASSSDAASTESTAASEASNEPVTITFAQYSGSGDNEQYLQQMVDNYMKENPNVTIDLQTYGYDDYFTQMTAKVSGGDYKVTKAAVKAFQSHNGLNADGIAGRETQELLFSSDAVPADATPRPSPTPEPPRYTLMVDVVNQITRAYTYDETGEYNILVREMICSTGTAQSPTPCGTTIMPKKRARWGYFPTWGSHAQYLTRIDSSNAFHSVL